MAVQAAAVTVTTTATLLNTFADTDGVFGNSIALYNAGSVTVYIGGAGVTATSTTQGLPLAAGGYVTVDCKPGDAVYGIVAAGTCAVNVLASGV